MNMSLRWYGPGYDTVTLEQIRQIPGVRGVITTLYGTQPGEVWDREEIRSLKKTVEDAGLSILGIESVNVHDDIKTGAKDRDRYIDNYITTLERLGEEDIQEVIIATNPNIEGETTASYLARTIKPLGVTVSRLASGLPVGGDLEYADELTLGRAIEARRAL